MITQVEIENFQSHRHTIVSLVDGVNVVIGPSDAGKSAVFRAINWVRSNRPLGDAFRSNWGGDTKVTVTTSDGHTIQRIRTDRDNMYVLDNELILKAFGTEPPEEVFTLLQLDSFNVQTQDDGPFLLSLSPGEAAQLLNRAASIDGIDVVIGNLKKEHGAITKAIQFNTAQLEKYENDTKQYSNLPMLTKEVDLLEYMDQMYVELGANVTKLEGYIDDYRIIQKNLWKYRHISKADVILGSANEKVSQSKTLEQAVVAQYHFIQQYSSTAEALRCLPNMSKADKHINTAEQGLNMAKALKQAMVSEKELVQHMVDVSEDIEDIEERIKALEIQYHDIAPDVCPVCGGPMNKEIE